MDPFQIRQAIREVQALKGAILEKQRFRGYSGRARALGGVIALLAALALEFLPIKIFPHRVFATWGIVFQAAAFLNYGAVVYWWMRGRQPMARLRVPQLVETFALWLIGGVLTLALWQRGEADLLYATWMLLFGFAQVINRHYVPAGGGWLGAYYITAGLACTVWADSLFLQPLVMGGVFFVGELAGGILFHVDGDLRRLRHFFRPEAARPATSTTP